MTKIEKILREIQELEWTARDVSAAQGGPVPFAIANRLAMLYKWLDWERSTQRFNGIVEDGAL